MTAERKPHRIPDAIVEKVKSGECILFLGAMASAATSEKFGYRTAPPSGGELSNLLADVCGYTGSERSNLMRVSLYFQLQTQKGLSRQELVSTIQKFMERDGIEPSPALRMLAALPFKMIITTNYDRLFDVALADATTREGRRKKPLIYVYSPTEPAAKDVPLDPTVEKPVLFKLHGDIDKPASVVITEEDYITFIQRMGTRHPQHYPIPEEITARMRSWSILFIGYGLKDWNLRLLLRALRWHAEAANFGLSYSVDPFPDDLIVAVMQHSSEPIVSFIREDLWDFVPELYARCLDKAYSS